MSCLDTGGPTQGSSPTSVPCARRSLPAATTCQNTSKSTVSHGAAGQFTQRTNAFLRSLGLTVNTANAWVTLVQTNRPREQGVSVWVRVHAWNLVTIVSVKEGLVISAVCACPNLLCKRKPTQLPSCDRCCRCWCFGVLYFLWLFCFYLLPQHEIRQTYFHSLWIMS